MKNVTFATMATIMAYGAPVCAQDFTGPYVQAGLGVAKGHSELDFSDWFNDKVDETQLNGTLAAGYAQSFGDFNIGANIAYTLDDQKAGRTIQDFPGNAAEKGDAVSVRVKHMWAVNLEPGVHVGSRGLLYGKLSYSWADGVWRFERPLFRDSSTGPMKLKGYGLGAGYKHDLAPGLYGFTEVQKTWFDRADVPITVVTEGVTSTYLDRYDVATTMAVVGIGFRFSALAQNRSDETNAWASETIWSGPYVGVHAGYTSLKPDYSEPVVPNEPRSVNPNANGIGGGVLAGYNIQTNGIVAGWEADFGLANANADANPNLFNDYSAFDLKWNSHLRARVGYPVGKTMIFAAGGLALARIGVDDVDAAWGEQTKTYVGFTLGGGVEHAVTKNLSIRAEYLFDKYGKKEGGIGGEYHYNFDVNPSTHNARAAVAYRF